MSDAPCYRCPDRHLGCHATCEAYKAFKEEKEHQRVLRQYDFITAVDDYEFDRRLKSISEAKRKGKKNG